MNSLSSSRITSVLALSPFVFALWACDEMYVSPRIDRTVEGVEGFDLVFDESVSKAEFGLFGVGYAIKANYGYFNYQGKTYRSVGGGSVLIRPIVTSQASFEVRETASAQDQRGNVSVSLLQVVDKTSGQEIARRRLVAGEAEDGTGWTGDHAVKFVRKVLVYPQAPGRPWVVPDYPKASTQIGLTKSVELTPYASHRLPNACPENLKIERKPHSSTVEGPGFEFLPRNPLKLVTCNNGLVLVASGVYASNFYFDVLTLDGQHVSQGYVKLPLPLGASWAELKAVSLDTKSIEVMLLANSRVDWKSPLTAHAALSIKANK
jgi:hypothetical protein